MRLEVLRLGHRPQRDKRITTHVCLTARALGAEKVHIAEEDPSIEASVQDVTKRFGGDFSIHTGTGWKGVLRRWKKEGGKIIHLTMYGKGLTESLQTIQKAADTAILIAVGAEKVPAQLYDLADWNIAVGNQPHSEVAALALLMDRLRDGAWERDIHPDAELEIIPQERGKKMRERR